MAGMDVNARLTLDASGFIGPMTKAQAQAEATGRAAAKSAREAAAAQAVAAKFAGDAVTAQSVRILAAQRAQAQASRDFAQVQSLNRKGLLDEASGSQTAAAALQRLTAAKLATAEASRVQEHAEHAQISQRMAASAAVRGLENGNAGVRSVENFLTTIPGVGKALQNIFPVIGATAFISIIVEMGAKLVELGQKTRNAASATRDAFQDAHDKSQVRVDDLELENQKIQDQIAKISGHPNNGLATALIEAKKYADELVGSLQEDRKQLEALLKEHDTGVFGGLLSALGLGAASTGEQNEQLLGDQSKLTSQLRDLTVERDAATVGLTDKKKIDAATAIYVAGVRAAYQKQIDANRAEAKRLGEEQAKSRAAADAAGLAVGPGSQYGAPLAPRTIDNSQKIAQVEGRARQLEQAQKSALVQASIIAGNVTLGGVKQGKELGEEAGKANELRLKALEGQLAEWKTLAPVSAKAIYDFWEVQKSTFATGSQQYNTIVEKQATLAVEGARKAAEAISQYVKRQKELAAEAGVIALVDQTNGRFQRDARRAGRDAQSENLDVGRYTAANAAREDEARIAELLGRSMTQVAAATELAAVHARAYNVELASLQGKRKLIEGIAAGDISDDERGRQLAGNQRELDQLQSGRRIQSMQDQYNINPSGSTIPTALSDALTQFARQVTDAGKAVEGVFMAGLQATNQGIVRQLTERHTRGQHIFGNVGGDIARNATGTALQGAEGMLLKGFRFGGSKAPKGTVSDPIHVVMASVASAASSVASLGKGGFSSLLSMLHVPGFAEGVSSFGGGWAMVGEKGPELLNLPRGSNITPNHKLGDAMGSGDTHHWTIDARGAHDPAQVEAAVSRGIAAAAPHIMSGTIKQIDSRNARLPRSARG